MKKFAAILLVMLLAFSMVTGACAAAPAEPAKPMWSNVASIMPALSVENGVYSSLIVGYTGTTKIVCTLILYEETSTNVYKEVDRMTETYNGQAHEFIGYYPLKSGVHYKLVTNATVTRNGVPETVSVTFS